MSWIQDEERRKFVRQRHYERRRARGANARFEEEYDQWEQTEEKARQIGIWADGIANNDHLTPFQKARLISIHLNACPSFVNRHRFFPSVGTVIKEILFTCQNIDTDGCTRRGWNKKSQAIHRLLPFASEFDLIDGHAFLHRLTSELCRVCRQWHFVAKLTRLAVEKTISRSYRHVKWGEINRPIGDLIARWRRLDRNSMQTILELKSDDDESFSMANGNFFIFLVDNEMHPGNEWISKFVWKKIFFRCNSHPEWLMANLPLFDDFITDIESRYEMERERLKSGIQKDLGTVSDELKGIAFYFEKVKRALTRADSTVTEMDLMILKENIFLNLKNLYEWIVNDFILSERSHFCREYPLIVESLVQEIHDWCMGTYLDTVDLTRVVVSFLVCAF